MKIKTSDLLGIGLMLLSIFTIYLAYTMQISLFWKSIGVGGGIIVLISEIVYIIQFVNKS